MPISPLHFPTDAQLASTTSLLDVPAPREVSEWLRYDRPAEYESLGTRVEVPTRDGTVLVGMLYRPARNGEPVEGAFPSLVVQFSPYDFFAFGTSQQNYLAERGFVVLTCSVRGSMESGGEWTSWFPGVEARDNYDLIEWLAAQPFSDGHVGQVGASYGSITAYRVAALRPPHLDAILPIVSPTNIHSEWIRPGGVPTEVGHWWACLGPVVTKEGHASTLSSFEEHPYYDEFWQQIATTNKLPDVEVPALHVGGYYDIFKHGGFDALEQRPDKTWLLYGPWTHALQLSVPGAAPTPFTADPSDSISYATVLQWFDYWLAQRPGATLPPSRIISYEDRSQRGSGSWTGSQEWPPADATARRLYPTSNGELTPDLPATGETAYFVNTYDGPSACVIGCLPTDADQAQTMSEFDTTNGHGRYTLGRTTFTTPAFTDDVTVSGPVELHLRASLSAEDTYFVSKLEVVTAEGQVLPLETGYLRAQLRSSLERPETITPGEALDYTIRLGHIHFRFDTGQRLRISLSGGDIPRVLPTNPSGLVTVQHGEGTYVDLPLTGF